MKVTRRLRGSFEIRTQTPETIDDALSLVSAGNARPAPAQQVRDYIADARGLADSADPKFEDLATQIHAAATDLEEQFNAARHADLIAAAAIELTELVCELHANQSRQMQAGLKTMLGGRKGSQLRKWDDTDDHALVEAARRLLADGTEPKDLTSKCIRIGHSKRGPRQTRRVLQAAGLVPTREKRDI